MTGAAVMGSSRSLDRVVAIAVALELERELRAAGRDDAAPGHDVDDVGLDVVEQPLIVGDDQERRGRGRAAR